MENKNKAFLLFVLTTLVFLSLLLPLAPVQTNSFELKEPFICENRICIPVACTETGIVYETEDARVGLAKLLYGGEWVEENGTVRRATLKEVMELEQDG